MGFWDLPEEGLPRHSDDEERVLVALMPSAQDWARLCAEHWYRIPLAKAPRHISAEYMAFYHPKNISATRWTIPCYAPVRSYAVCTRGELLPEEPDHPRANDLYYRIDLGPLIALPQPIPSRSLRRITFIETTLSRLLQAREVNDLWLRSAPELGRWRALHLGEPRPSAYDALGA